MTNKEKVMIYIDNDLKKQVQERAENEGRSMSNLFIKVMKKYLKEIKNEEEEKIITNS